MAQLIRIASLTEHLTAAQDVQGSSQNFIPVTFLSQSVRSTTSLSISRAGILVLISGCSCQILLLLLQVNCWWKAARTMAGRQGLMRSSQYCTMPFSSSSVRGAAIGSLLNQWMVWRKSAKAFRKLV